MAALYRFLSLVLASALLAAAGCSPKGSHSLPGDEAPRWWTQTAPPPSSAARPLTVEAAIRFVTIGDPQGLTSMTYERQAAAFSPNGQLAAVVLTRGNPERETTEGALLLYRSSQLMDNPQPQVLAEFASATNYQPIAKVRWLDDHTLIFAGTRGEKPSQVYKVDIPARRMTQLTSESAQLKAYEVSDDGAHLAVFTALPLERAPDADQQCLKQGCRVEAMRLYDADRGGNLWDRVWGSQLSAYELKTGQRTSFVSVDRDPSSAAQCFFGFRGGLSPDGRFGLQICEMHRWPQWWSEYRFDADMARSLKANNTTYARQLFLYDLKARTHRPLTGAPEAIGTYADPIWIDGGRRVVLAGAVEPLSGVSGAERERRAATWGVLMVDPEANTIERIADLPPEAFRVTGARWDPASDVLAVQLLDEKRQPLPGLFLRRAAQRWTSIPADAVPPVPAKTRFRLSVRQSANQRPVLVAEDLKTGARSDVLDPNPWLSSVKLGRVEELTWTTDNGSRKWYGAVYYPPDYTQGRRYPLVLQTHGMRPGEFSLHGYVRNFVAQPLAARDIIVLQISEGRSIRDVITTPQEWPTVRAGFEAAIDALDARGLIDRARVGTVGWSRTGPHTGYALTHSAYPFAAAVMMDTSDFGWFSYLSWGDAREFDLDYGAAPFGAGLKPWLETVPSFNLARVRTPVLMWNASSAMGQWDWYAGLRRLGKPVEYWVVPDGEHELFKVGQRLLTNRLAVDWFDFWLNGHEDDEPAKAAQYRRWRTLRDQQAAVLAQPRPPLYEWTAKPIPEKSESR